MPSTCVIAGTYDDVAGSGPPTVYRAVVVEEKMKPRALITWSAKRAATSDSFFSSIAETNLGFGGGRRLVNATDQQANIASCCVRRIGNVDDSGYGYNVNFVNGGSNDASSLPPQSIHLTQWACHGFRFQHGADHGDGMENAYLLLGGRRMHVKVGTFQTPTSLGTDALTGLGFEPQAVLFLGAVDDSTTTDTPGGTRLGFGAAGASGQFAMATYGAWLSVPPERKSKWDSDICVLAIDGSGDVVRARMDSFDADGFTLDYLTADEERQVAYMAIGYEGDGGIDVGVEAQPTSTGTQSVTGLAFDPEAVMFFSTCTDQSSIQPHSNWSVGGGDMGMTRSGFVGCPDAAAINPNPAQTRWADSVLTMAHASFAPGVDAEADLASLDAGGFTLDWVSADGTPRNYGWIALAGFHDCPCSGALPILDYG